MKKILEVLQYGESDIRFNTDFDVKKNPNSVVALMSRIAMAMGTTLWGGNEQSVLAVLRSMMIADLALSVNRKELIKMLDDNSAMLARSLEQARQEIIRKGGKIQVFGPESTPSGHHS